MLFIGRVTDRWRTALNVRMAVNWRTRRARLNIYWLKVDRFIIGHNGVGSGTSGLLDVTLPHRSLKVSNHDVERWYMWSSSCATELVYVGVAGACTYPWATAGVPTRDGQIPILHQYRTTVRWPTEVPLPTVPYDQVGKTRAFTPI